MLAQDGKLSDSFALTYALNSGPFGRQGTDEALIRKTLEGKIKDAIDKIKKDYKAAYGRDLETDLAGEVDGRDGFEIGQMLKGKPQTPEEIVARANEAWEFERGSGAGLVSNGIVDLFSGRSKVLDMQHSRIKEAYEKAKDDGKIDDTEKKRIEQLYGWQGQDAKNYQEAKDSVTNTAALAGTVAAAAALTALTGGAGSPALVAILTQAGLSSGVAAGLATGGIAFASGLAGMGIKAGILGDSYGGQDAGIDLGRTALTALTAGLSKGLEPGIQSYLGIAEKLKRHSLLRLRSLPPA